jgi:hypothetical protein
MRQRKVASGPAPDDASRAGLRQLALSGAMPATAPALQRLPELDPLATRQTIADSQAAPEFQENLKRLKAERLAREAGLKAKGK